MASTINADTSDGLELASDTSGIIEFQSAGVTKAGVNATGLTGDGSQLTGLPVNGLGVGQTWTNVTSSRANNVVYTNSTGKPIAVMVSTGMSTNERMQTFIGSNQIADDGISTAYGGVANSSFTVPNGITYKINMSLGTIVLWWELR